MGACRSSGNRAWRSCRWAPSISVICGCPTHSSPMRRQLTCTWPPHPTNSSALPTTVKSHAVWGNSPVHFSARVCLISYRGGGGREWADDVSALSSAKFIQRYRWIAPLELYNHQPRALWPTCMSRPTTEYSKPHHSSYKLEYYFSKRAQVLFKSYTTKFVLNQERNLIFDSD